MDFMKAIVLILMALFSSNVSAHDYYFAFAEVAYNEESMKIEATLTISTHDLEIALRTENPEIEDLGRMKLGSKETEIVNDYLLNHFKIEGKTETEFRLLGFESNLKGTTKFYFESEILKMGNSLKVTFDLLMEFYKEQQNKITFYYKGNSYTKPFLYAKRIQIINLNKE